MDPNPQHQWIFHPSPHLGSLGIYTQAEITQLNQAYLFPAERSAITNSFAAHVMLNGISEQHIPYHKLLDESYIQEKVSSGWAKMTGWFDVFGARYVFLDRPICFED